jgi:hypothetical protein
LVADLYNGLFAFFFGSRSTSFVLCVYTFASLALAAGAGGCGEGRRLLDLCCEAARGVCATHELDQTTLLQRLSASL